jgi:acyl phosphate:glycerol-3-phosphate acyltransferase
MLTFIAVIICYLIGSLSSATILSKILNTPDPRKEGSGNAGATNVLRTAGKKIAAYTVIGDAAKGIIALIIARILGIHGAALALLLLIVVLGHIFPVFFKFKGGKGVATALGSMLVLNPIIAFASIIVWVVIAYITRYASLASIIAIIANVVFSIAFGYTDIAFPLLLTAILIVWKHKANIERLMAGKESKIKIKM